MEPKFSVSIRFGSGSRFFRFGPRFSVFLCPGRIKGDWMRGLQEKENSILCIRVHFLSCTSVWPTIYSLSLVPHRQPSGSISEWSESPSESKLIVKQLCNGLRPIRSGGKQPALRAARTTSWTRSLATPSAVRAASTPRSAARTRLLRLHPFLTALCISPNSSHHSSTLGAAGEQMVGLLRYMAGLYIGPRLGKVRRIAPTNGLTAVPKIFSACV